jgi:Predicted oxidoreductases (related to aryl-alcohol dehydrogenases)
MEYVKLGNTGLDVSKICLGCMGFGDSSTGFHGWTLKEDESNAIIKRAVEQGINFFDTANCYSYGTSEEYLGRALKAYTKRNETVIATKGFIRMGEGPNRQGLSRKAIMQEADASLKRLGTDYIDLYIIHRWDYTVAIEETMAALNDLVKSGKVLYIGASAMFAWQFQKAQYTAERNGWTKFVSMQNHYNLIYREDEREMIPFCKQEKIALTPYSPLASGRLARGICADTKRAETDSIQKSKYGATEAEDQIIIDRVAEIAEKRGITRSQVSLAWLMQKACVPVVGSTKTAHLDDSVGSVGIVLAQEEMNFLEETYVPHRIAGPLVPETNWIHGTNIVAKVREIK